jgi:NAD(P)-dependent dehydrogenase (short-subunit alcohol dehydrogenase family)
MARLDGKVAIVSGSARGIGERCVRTLAERGAAVVVADINGPLAETVAADLRSSGHAAIATTTDMGKESDIEAMVKAAVAEFGRLDILHNNAAMLDPVLHSRDREIENIDAELFEYTLRVNVVGYTLAIKHAVPHMISQGAGVIINTSSVTGQLAEAIRPMYGISKAAIYGLTRNVAVQYGKRGIRCVGISPGHILTPGGQENAQARNEKPAEHDSNHNKHELLPRMGQPEDIAYLAAFLASDEASWITGITIAVDGGFTAHFPSWADKMEAARAAEAESGA